MAANWYEIQQSYQTGMGISLFFFLVLCRRYLDTGCQMCVCVCVCEPFMQASTHTERERKRGSVCKILQVPL